jgi:hypothetical protein
MGNSIWPHLPTSDKPQSKQSENSIGEALWPHLSDKAKAKDQMRERERQRLLRDLREATARIRASKERQRNAGR